MIVSDLPLVYICIHETTNFQLLQGRRWRGVLHIFKDVERDSNLGCLDLSHTRLENHALQSFGRLCDTTGNGLSFMRYPGSRCPPVGDGCASLLIGTGTHNTSLLGQGDMNNWFRSKVTRAIIITYKNASRILGKTHNLSFAATTTVQSLPPSIVQIYHFGITLQITRCLSSNSNGQHHPYPSHPVVILTHPPVRPGFLTPP